MAELDPIQHAVNRAKRDGLLQLRTRIDEELANLDAEIGYTTETVPEKPARRRMGQAQKQAISNGQKKRHQERWAAGADTTARKKSIPELPDEAPAFVSPSE